MCKIILIPAVLLVLAGCTEREKRYTEQDVNRFAMESFVRNRSSHTLQSVAVLEQLRQGSVSNAIERIESHLDKDIEQLRFVLKQANISDTSRTQVQVVLSRAEAYRAQYPRPTMEQKK